MQLYLHCPNCDRKIILKSEAKTRHELAIQFGNSFFITCPHCQHQSLYNVQNVFAETDQKIAATGAIIGGLIGLIFGPEGALIGSAIGGAGGLARDEEEKKAVQRFNNS
jgi:DNA-directed RNA polymerase subunit RPC12/RpoP